MWETGKNYLLNILEKNAGLLVDLGHFQIDLSWAFSFDGNAPFNTELKLWHFFCYHEVSGTGSSAVYEKKQG